MVYIFPFQKWDDCGFDSRDIDDIQYAVSDFWGDIVFLSLPSSDPAFCGSCDKNAFGFTEFNKPIPGRIIRVAACS